MNFEEIKKEDTLQNYFLNQARKSKEEFTIFLIGGIKLTGRILAFDNHSISIPEAESYNPMLIYKHAISTIIPGKVKAISPKKNNQEYD